MLDLIHDSLAEDYTAKKARNTVSIPSVFQAKNHSIPATLLRQYQSHWKEHNSFLYYRIQLYVLAAGRGRMGLLQLHHNDPIAGHFGAKGTLELVSKEY